MTAQVEKICLVTGVGPGTGSAIVRRFAAEGYRVAMLARNTGATNLVMIGMVVIGAVGFAFDMVLRLIQRRVLYWVPDIQSGMAK